MKPTTCYIICSAPRSGSHLLSYLMTDTQLAGFPQEHFNPWFMGDAINEFPDQLIYEKSHITNLIDKYTSPNGVFGTKGQFDQIVDFVGLTRLESFFPTSLKYIFIQRGDKIGQAVSLARAEQTDQWMSGQAIQREPQYNYFQIRSCLREIKLQEKGWETYFMERGIKPYRVNYEELAANPEPVILGALDYLEIKLPAGFQVPTPRIQKQGDSLSEEWIARYTRSES
jgi:trehalose 2-sulfotransferase